jgi:hypothetical protein
VSMNGKNAALVFRAMVMIHAGQRDIGRTSRCVK